VHASRTRQNLDAARFRKTVTNSRIAAPRLQRGAGTAKGRFLSGTGNLKKFYFKGRVEECKKTTTTTSPGLDDLLDFEDVGIKPSAPSDKKENWDWDDDDLEEWLSVDK